MDDYLYLLNENKKCRSFNIESIESSTKTLVAGRKGLIITDLIIYNSSMSKGTIELYVTSDIAGDEVVIVTVEAGRTFNFNNITGLNFWTSAEVRVRVGDNTTGNVFIGYVRSRGRDYSIWSSESINKEVNVDSLFTLTKGKSITKNKSLFSMPGYWYKE